MRSYVEASWKARKLYTLLTNQTLVALTAVYPIIFFFLLTSQSTNWCSQPWKYSTSSYASKFRNISSMKDNKMNSLYSCPLTQRWKTNGMQLLNIKPMKNQNQLWNKKTWGRDKHKNFMSNFKHFILIDVSWCQ
jgi:hypothetical protein